MVRNRLPLAQAGSLASGRVNEPASMTAASHSGHRAHSSVLRRPLCRAQRRPARLRPERLRRVFPLQARSSPYPHPFPIEPGVGATFHVALATYDHTTTFNIAAHEHSSISVTKLGPLDLSISAAPLLGCTALSVVSRGTVAVAHVWEDPDMRRDPWQFDKVVLEPMRRELRGNWGGKEGRTTAYIITPSLPLELQTTPIATPLYGAQVMKIRQVIIEAVRVTEDVRVVLYDQELRNLLGRRNEGAGLQLLMQYTPVYQYQGKQMKLTRLWLNGQMLSQDML